MKPPDPHCEFNGPREMLARAAFVGMFFVFVAGLLLVVGGVVEQQARSLLAGGAAWTIAGLARHWLVRTGRFAALDEAFDGMVSPQPHTREERCSELVKLLQLWEAQEQRRGTPEFDPWTLQALRNDIRALVDSDPALQELLRDPRAQDRAA